ncbi:MAG: hypothetical protein ACRDYC_05635 [Acidimicrobiales bacterium]
MSLSIVGSSSATTGASTSATSIALTKPSGVAFGDLILLVVGAAATSALGTPSAPSGFTAVSPVSSGTTTARQIAVFYRVANGAEASTFSVGISTGAGASGWCIVIRGAAVTPFDPTPSNSGVLTSSTTILMGSATINPTQTGDLLIWCGDVYSYAGPSGTSITIPGGFTAAGSAVASTSGVADTQSVLATQTGASSGSQTANGYTTVFLENGVFFVAIPALIGAIARGQTAVTPTLAPGATVPSPGPRAAASKPPALTIGPSGGILLPSSGGAGSRVVRPSVPMRTSVAATGGSLITGITPSGLFIPRSALISGQPLPHPVPLIPVSPIHAIEYLFCDLFTGEIMGTLPLTGVTFTLQMNGAGPFAGTLAVEDPRIAALDWIGFTRPNRNSVFVAIDGELVYGGIVSNRTYTMSTQNVALSALDFTNYMAQRVQAADYSITWATTPAGAAQIAFQVLTDALAVPFSLQLNDVAPGPTPPDFQITFSAPITQQQTVASIVQQLQAMGYLVGFDYADDVGWVNGVPEATVTFSYPRRGRPAGTTGLFVDIAQAIEFVYPEDGSTQADSVIEMSSSTGTAGSTTGTYTPAMTEYGYPLLEAVESHISFSQTAEPQSALDAYTADDLALYAFPPVVPSVTLPLFGSLKLSDFIVGDDMRLVVPKGNPRFPNGMDFYWRNTRADVTVLEQGVSTMTLTFQMPPSETPQYPPQ